MQENNLRHLPVLTKNKLVGLITLKDILKIEPELFETIVEDIELREEHRKPISQRVTEEDLCGNCGRAASGMKQKDNMLMCALCRKKA
jgi:predicted transcriptional regulator